jgi:AcrR family transcriptional regulator
MPRSALRPSDVEAFRKRAIRAATRLFAARGYEAVTLRAIAASLRVSPMTPYRYFENKAEIFALVRAEAFRRFANAQAAAHDMESEPLARLFAMREAYVRFALREPDSYRVMFDLMEGPDQAHPAIAEQNGRSFSILLSAVEDAIAAGHLQGEPLTLAHLLWSSLHGIVSLHLSGKLTVGRTLEELLDAPPIAIGSPRSTRQSRAPKRRSTRRSHAAKQRRR